MDREIVCVDSVFYALDYYSACLCSGESKGGRSFAHNLPSVIYTRLYGAMAHVPMGIEWNGAISHFLDHNVNYVNAEKGLLL